jgi:hypothetical protein
VGFGICQHVTQSPIKVQMLMLNSNCFLGRQPKLMQNSEPKAQEYYVSPQFIKYDAGGSSFFVQRTVRKQKSCPNY